MAQNYIHTNHPGYEASSVACEHATFPNWKINASHHFSLFAWAEIMSFSVCRQMSVELLRYHTYTVSLIPTYSRTHNISSQLLCLGREVANQIFFSVLAYGRASSSEQSSTAMKSWRREIQWITSRAAAICLQGNHCTIILKDKAHSSLHNSLCMSQTSVLMLKWEEKCLKIS